MPTSIFVSAEQRARAESPPPDAKKRVFLPLWAKLTVPIILLTALVGWGTYYGLVSISRSNLLKSKATAAEMVVKLFSASVTPAVVFADETEMQRSVGDLARNPEVTDVELWLVPPPGEAPSTKPSAEFHRSAKRIGRPAATQAQLRVLDQYLEVVEPIIDNEKKVTAVAVARFSLAREQAVLAALARQTLVAAAAVGTGLTLALVLMLARIAVLPLSRLKTAAQNLQNGKGSDKRVVPQGRFEDEVGQLALVFVEMADAVADREARLATRNKELRLILDNVSQGFVTVTPDGVIQAERSAIVDRWLPDLGIGAQFAKLIALLDPKQSDMAAMGWSQLDSGFLPLELCLDQLPKRATRNGQHFAFEYQPVIDREQLSRVVLVMSDITADVERKRVEEDQQEFAALVEHLVRDRRGFLEFWGELEKLVGRVLAGSSDKQLLRDLHTIKGNSRFFGMWRLSQCCHRLEDGLEERKEKALTAAEREDLNGEWEGIRARVGALTKGASAFLELSETDYEKLGHGLRERMSHEMLAELVSEFRYEPTSRRLERARDTIENACRRTGKPVAEVVLVDNGVRLPPERWVGFWTAFVHLLTNAVEHGLETEEERVASGKSGTGTVRVVTRTGNGEFTIEVADDGRGIDWDSVAKKAAAKGLPHRTRKELELALLSEGFSMKAEVTEGSGRGVGMSAVVHAASALGGEISVVSERGKGATWRLRFPIAATKVPTRDSLLPPSSHMPKR